MDVLRTDIEIEFVAFFLQTVFLKVEYFSHLVTFKSSGRTILLPIPRVRILPRIPRPGRPCRDESCGCSFDEDVGGEEAMSVSTRKPRHRVSTTVRQPDTAVVSLQFSYKRVTLVVLDIFWERMVFFYLGSIFTAGDAVPISLTSSGSHSR